MSAGRPQRFDTLVGPLPQPGSLPASDRAPFTTVQAAREGFVDRGGVRLWYAVWGTKGTWLAFAPSFQIVHAQMLKAVVPYLSHHFRVVTTDARGNGRSDRPAGQAAYGFDHFHDDFVAVLDEVGADRAALVGISAGAMTVLRVAAEQPQRVSHLVIAGGFAESLVQGESMVQRMRMEEQLVRSDWPGYIDYFMSTIFSEPHSTKPYEDGVRYGWATTGQTIDWVRQAWLDNDVRALAGQVRCPTLVMHGDGDRRVPHAKGREIQALVPGARLLTIEGGGHVTAVRDPVLFNRAVRDFVAGGVPRGATWTRAMKRKRKALFLSSPIGLGHAQRDLAIARELRKLHPDLQIDWFTVDPAARYLEREGERLHPITARLANESRHFESVAGEHDLSAFFALRTMDEIMAHNFMAFSDVVEAEHYDLVIGDEAWDVDYHYHENPELKRQPFVFLTDFVGCLPMNPDDPREAHLCADRNADDIEHVERYPHVRDTAIFIGNREDVTEERFGPGLPGIREWTDRNFCYCGYALPFDPKALADTEGLRAKHGYGRHEKIVIASVGGTAVGRRLLQRIAAAFPRMKRELPDLRLVLVTGPRMDSANDFPVWPGLEVRPYVHNLYEHLACCDLALVQGGLSTTMELVATNRPFLSFPLQRHFEQCVHVRRRLANYGADNAVDYAATLDPDALAQRALSVMHRPVRYRPVETDGAARAALRIAQVLENRQWVR